MIALVTLSDHIKKHTYCGSTGFVRCEVWGSFGSDFVNATYLHVTADLGNCACAQSYQIFYHIPATIPFLRPF